MADVLVMAAFGVVGYVMRRFDFSPAALIIAFVLSKGAEESFRQSMLVSRDGLMIFLQRPFAVGCFVVALIFLAAQFARYRRMRRQNTKAQQ